MERVAEPPFLPADFVTANFKARPRGWTICKGFGASRNWPTDFSSMSAVACGTGTTPESISFKTFFRFRSTTATTPSIGRA
jgi:hypothetical protein